MPKKNSLDADPAALDRYLDALPVIDEAWAAELEDAHDLEKDPAFVADCLKGQLVEDILKAMQEQGVTKAALADRLGKSRQYVTKVLNEKANFTIESIAEMACALNMRVDLRLHPLEAQMLAAPGNRYAGRTSCTGTGGTGKELDRLSYVKEENDE